MPQQKQLFNVFGRMMAIERVDGRWRCHVLGTDGKKRRADLAIPSELEPGELAQYLYDIYHESATPSNGDVFEVRSENDSDMQDYYAARANEYDGIYQKPERQADLRQIEAWLPTVFAGRSVLEIACGTGYWTQFYAPRAAEVLALDSSVETMRIAATRVPAARVRFLQGDAYRLPFRQATFDAAFAGFWWSHIPLGRISDFLGGLHATLRPGARVVLLDNRYVSGSSTPISERDDEGNSYQSRKLADGSSHRVLKNFPSREELLAAVAPHADRSDYREWQYFWAIEYTLKQGQRRPA